MIKKLVILFLSAAVLFGAVFGFYYSRPLVVVDESVRGAIYPYAVQLAREMNKKRALFPFMKQYRLYTANFEKNRPVRFEKPAENSILWLGSTRNFIPDLQNFDIVLASTPLLKDFLEAGEDEAFYFPLFTDELDIDTHQQDEKFIAVIGNPKFIEDILKQKKVYYQKYQPDEAEKILSDKNKFLAVFAAQTAFSDESIDLHPVFLTLEAQKIPLITYWGWPEVEERLNLFNDFVSFYMDKNDAAKMIDRISKEGISDEMVKMAENARKLVKSHYSLKSAVYRLSSILKNRQEPEDIILSNSFNIDLPVAVGHKAAGDFCLAKDLSTYLKPFWKTTLSFFNSPVKYKSRVNLLIRGIDFSQNDLVGKTNIYYLIYPQFSDDAPQEEIENEAAYLEKLALKLKEVDAVASSSQKIADSLSKFGVKAYYVPQFTDEKRFIPIYNEALASEVLFVGINAPYRRAAKIALEHHLPITIYGPNWGDAAKARYVDNQELPQYYASAKIVLNDSRREMLVYGIISNRIFDATATGTLVISDYMKEIEEIYGDSVPMWKTEKELVELIKYYLDPEHEEERLEKAKRAQQITLEHFTAQKAAKRFNEIIQEL